eukprot:COSAG01_NODE_39677_length_473_cov_1.080214_1_plen_32_part_10
MGACDRRPRLAQAAKEEAAPPACMCDCPLPIV